MPYSNSIIASQDSSPEPTHSLPPSPAFDENGIFICSAPDTSPTGTPSADEFETPPEDSRRSSSEEPPPPNLPYSHGEESDGARTETPSVGTDCPRVVEMTGVELDSVRVGEKRGISVEEPSPPRKVRVSVDSLVIANTHNMAAAEEKSEKVKAGGQIQIGVTVNMDVETEELDCGTEQVIDTGGTLDLQQEQEEGMEIEEDLSMQARRNLPPSWEIQKQGKEDDKVKASNTEEGSSSTGNVDVVMEMLKWHAEEQRQKKKKKSDHDDDAPVDFLATLRRRGVVFPEPKWWHKMDDK